MSVSILECLQNANMNLDNLKGLGMGFLPMVKGQLNNAVVLLEKGYPLETQVEDILEEFGDVEDAPEYQEV